MLLSIIIFLILLATGLHMLYGHKHDLKMDDTVPAPTSEPILSRTTVNTISIINPTDEHDQSTSSDEITPLITRTEGEVDSSKHIYFQLLLKLILFFSCTKFN